MFERISKRFTKVRAGVSCNNTVHKGVLTPSRQINGFLVCVAKGDHLARIENYGDIAKRLEVGELSVVRI